VGLFSFRDYNAGMKEKLRILVFNPNKGGCAYYRALMPMAKLMELYPDEIEVRFDENPLGIKVSAEEMEKAKKDWIESKGLEYTPDMDPSHYADAPPSLTWRDNFNFKNMKWADIIMISNISNFGGQYMTRVIGKAHEFGKFVHFDTDDLLTDLYDSHRLYDTYKNKQLGEITQFAYSKSHLVTVTQHKFAARIKPHCKAMLGVVRNAIDYNLSSWNADRKNYPCHKKVIRIGWAGGIHHIPDVRVFAGVPRLVNQMVGAERVRWDFYGHPPPSDDPEAAWQVEVWRDYKNQLLKGFKGHKNWQIHYALNPNDYGTIFANMDISIAPLAMNAFNDSKSDIKVAECGRYEVPLVASDVGCYSDTIKNGKTGYLLPAGASSMQWAKVLAKLVRDKSHVKQMGVNLKKITDEHYDINSVVRDRLNIYYKCFDDCGFDPRNFRKYEEELKDMPDDPQS